MQEKNESDLKTVDGFYEHKETGAVVELINEPALGVPLTNGFVKVGYVYVGKTDPRKKAEVVEKTSPKAK